MKVLTQDDICFLEEAVESQFCWSGVNKWKIIPFKHRWGPNQGKSCKLRLGFGFYSTGVGNHLKDFEKSNNSVIKDFASLSGRTAKINYKREEG